jgi:hypothetical protein
MAAERAALRTRLEGLVILLVAIGYLWETSNIPEFYQLPNVPGPTTFPNLLGIVFAAAGLWLLVSPQDLLDRFRGRQRAAAARAEGARADWHFYAIWAVILLYLWFMPTLGFPLATFLLIFAFMRLLGESRLAVLLAVAIGATAIIYVSFGLGLRVRLPLGVLEELVKAGLGHV